MTIEVVAARDQLSRTPVHASETDMESTAACITPVSEILNNTDQQVPLLINEAGGVEPAPIEEVWVAHEDAIFVNGLAAALAARAESGNIAPYHIAYVAYLHNALIESPTADIVSDAGVALSNMANPKGEVEEREEITEEKIAPKAALRSDKTLVSPEEAKYMAEDFTAETMLAPMIVASMRSRTPAAARKVNDQKLRATDLSLRMAKIRGDVDAVRELEIYRASLTE